MAPLLDPPKAGGLWKPGLRTGRCGMGRLLLFNKPYGVLSQFTVIGKIFNEI